MPLCSLSCIPHVSLMPMSLTSSIPSVSGHLAPRLCNVCLPHQSPSAREPRALPFSLGLTLDLPYEGASSVSPHTSCTPKYRHSLSQHRLSRRSRLLRSQSSLYQYRFESRAWSLRPLLLYKLRPHPLRPLQSTFRKSSRLQPYSRAFQPWQPLRS